MADSYIFHLLPPQWRKHELARDIANALGRPLDVSRRYAETLYRYIDAEGAPEDALDWLMWTVALPRRSSLSPRRKRNLIKTAWRTWSRKGTKGAIEEWVQAVAGIQSEVRSIATTACIAGIAVAGAICGPGVTANKWEIAIPAGSIDPEELREILAPMVPEQSIYRVVDLDGNILSDFPA